MKTKIYKFIMLIVEETRQGTAGRGFENCWFGAGLPVQIMKVMIEIKTMQTHYSSMTGTIP